MTTERGARGYTLTITPDMEFVTACQKGAFDEVAARLEKGEDPNTKAYVTAKGRLLGCKYSSDWGKFIMTHQSGDRMMGSALHYAVISERVDVVGLLLAFGASPTQRFNLPPHMPQEATVEELAAKNCSENAVLSKVMLLFKVWTRLENSSPKKIQMLAKLPEEVSNLRQYLEELVERHNKDDSLTLLNSSGPKQVKEGAEADAEKLMHKMLNEDPDKDMPQP
eukprot:TRINITY_DN36995_c0_g1_i1.p1 TRINITY_DN36995_c0_g1~~TRINITY_DN36995_c0_g1_i1.p1  ORF type:complete len:241 (+),score=61.02 TRINITY_DN36995_c0_g1_i1:57-725(+)